MADPTFTVPGARGTTGICAYGSTGWSLRWSGAATGLIRFALRGGFAPRAFALLETTGRRTGLARQTPVGNGLDGDTFWLVAAHGAQADYVRNLQAEPRVRVKAGGRMAFRDGYRAP